MTLRPKLTAILALAALLAPAPAALAAGTTPQLSYSDVLQRARAHEVKSAVFDDVRHTVTVELAGGRSATVSYPQGDTLLVRALTGGGARVDFASGASFNWGLALGIVGSLLLVALLIGLLARRRSAAQSASGGALRKEAQVTRVPAVRFSDVAGCPEVVEELAETIDFLRDPEPFARLGARMPGGIILHGPPGTGKTLVAKAVAGEAEVPFFAVSGSEFIERYVGVGASRVRDLFARARAQKNGAVVFIDEIDAIGRKRSGSGQSHQENDQTLNQILVELDGFDGRGNVVCIAATNRLDILDPALLRPGRFGRHVGVDLPNEEGRLAILGVHTAGKPLAEEVDLVRLAHVTAGSSGAQLADMANEAAIMAARAGRSVITQDDLEEGHLRVLAGPQKRTGMMAEGEERIVAYHEAGHVLTAELCETHEKAQRVTIRPRGRAAGLAVYGRKDRALHDAQYVHEEMVCVLGGRAAEQVVVGNVSSGAANDLQVVNQIARRAVEEFGFSPRTGQIIAAAHGQALPLSDQTRSIIDEEVERIVADAYRDALALLAEHRDALDRLATALLERKELDRLDITLALEGLEPGRQRFVHGHAMGPTGRPALRALPGREEAVAVTRYERDDEGLLVDVARWLRSRRRRPARASGVAAFSRRRDSHL